MHDKIFDKIESGERLYVSTPADILLHSPHTYKMPRTITVTEPYVQTWEMPKKLLSPEENAKAPYGSAWSWSLLLSTLDYYDDEGYQHQIYAKITLADTSDLDADWDGEHTDYTITGAVADDDTDACNCGGCNEEPSEEHR